jgi:hypothetical protein
MRKRFGALVLRATCPYRLTALLARRATKVAAIALANKIARIKGWRLPREDRRTDAELYHAAASEVVP